MDLWFRRSDGAVIEAFIFSSRYSRRLIALRQEINPRLQDKMFELR